MSRPSALLFTLAFALLAGPAPAAVLTLTLDDVPEVDCDLPFAESECTLFFSTTTGEDQTPGFCLFIEDANNFGHQGVYLWPARLVVMLDNLEGLESVEIDVWETHFAGSTRAFLYGEDGVIDSMSSTMEDGQTLTVAAGAETPVSLAVSAHEAYVWEIRLIGADITPVTGVWFVAIRAPYP